jgi:hypothetical protein
METFVMRFAPTPHVVIAHNTHSSLKERNLGFDAP